MSKRNLDRYTALRTTNIYETFIIGPRKFERQRFSYAHADSGHGGQELFQSGRVGVKRSKNVLPSLSPGDFFKASLPSTDVIIMGHILHDWGLEEKRELIAKAHAALPKGGALIVYEAIIDDERRQNAFGLLMSLNMLIETQAGFDFTGANCCAWMREAGFKETGVEPLCGPDSMVVGIK